MKKLYFTITGCVYRFGLAIFKPGMMVTLVKEPDNKYDREAIRAIADGLGTVGYVANSPKTVRGTSMSAGRLYDKIPKVINATVEYVLSDSVICSVEEKAADRLAEAAVLEKMPPEEETIFAPDASDLDLYSQEDTDYLLSEETDEEQTEPAQEQESLSSENVGKEEEEPETAYSNSDEVYSNNAIESETENADYSTIAEDPEEISAIEDSADPVPQQDPEEKTVSPEEIASALTAALAGFAGKNGSIPESAENIGAILSEGLQGLSANELESVLSNPSGLSAMDFISALTGAADTSDTKTDGIPTEDEASVQPDTVPDSPDIQDADVQVSDIKESNSPGLYFNTVRFPEEEADYTAPVNHAPAKEEETISPDSGAPEEENFAFSENSSVPDNSQELNEKRTEPDAPASADINVEEEFQSLNDTLSDLSEPENESADSTPARPDTDADEAAEEESDGITQPLIYDESELDENLAQLHLGDIDATYLSDSFLDKLKRKLRESS